VPIINIVTDITVNNRTEIISVFRHFNISVSFISANLNIIIAKTAMQAKPKYAVVLVIFHIDINE
jgi:hypothetical protein